MELGAVAVIDEVKGRRICASRYEHLNIAASLDLFSHPLVEPALGRKALEKAVFNALTEARMSVPMEYLDWVLRLIGRDAAKLCPSLPKSVR